MSTPLPKCLAKMLFNMLSSHGLVIKHDYFTINTFKITDHLRYNKYISGNSTFHYTNMLKIWCNGVDISCNGVDNFTKFSVFVRNCKQ